ncbi:hypothetical protein [Ekhidna sp.]|uniref:hypothetical protein n=1 Tax=Ekhidna sp. TaxID=2608089 RepID=UPI0035141074
MEKEHLHLLIHEEIYRLSSDEVITGEAVVEEMSTSENLQENEVAEPESEPIAKQEDAKGETETVNKDETENEPKQESPAIPIHEVEEPTEIPFAIFHSSTDEDEIALLQKIIDACKVPADDYKIFGNGFDQSVRFKKALVFIEKAKAFYSPIPYKGSEFLCSKPLTDLAKDQNEKAKLWGALQKFVL